MPSYVNLHYPFPNLTNVHSSHLTLHERQMPEMLLWKEAISEGRKKAREEAAENDDLMMDHVSKLQHVRSPLSSCAPAVHLLVELTWTLHPVGLQV
jgi:hypothetical protein